MFLPLLVACAPTEPKDSPPSPPAHSAEPAAHTGEGTPTDPPPGHSGGDTTPTADTGDPPASERDRLLRTYLAHLQRFPNLTQSNGLRGADLGDVCALWGALQPSGRDTFLTITHRLEGATLADGSNALQHVVTVYRVVGGENATSSSHGSCGGAEFNRLMMSMDPELHAALVAANGPGPRIDDIPTNGEWHGSSDLAGPHDPFTLSDETEDGAPRGQVHFFLDPGSAVANAPLGRMDLEDLVDPLALEMDQDYDCAHNSNPDCDYTFYGPFCLPEATRQGTDVYRATYGDFGEGWTPQGC